MNLYINGYRSNNEKLVNVLCEAAHFYAYKLLGGRMYRNIDVDLNLKRNLYKKEGAYGYCSIYAEASKPREFEIELDTSTENTVENLLTWLAHEFVHIKQFVRGELVDYEDGSVKWKSKVYRDGKVSYEDSPWEKEAYRLEDKLYLEFWNSYSERENGNR